ncbi:MAG: hypothetical protein Q9214_005367 [Letrouitia sp. 1 TL-2023]
MDSTTLLKFSPTGLALSGSAHEVMTNDKTIASNSMIMSASQLVSAITYSFNLPLYQPSSSVSITTRWPSATANIALQPPLSIGYPNLIPEFSPKTPTYLATSAQTAALTMTSAASRRPTIPAATTRMFLKQGSVDLNKETPYRVTAPAIPVYSPACLGNAYGGGYIIVPTVFVTNPEVKDSGNSTLRYNFSYGKNPSGLAYPNTTMIIIGTSSPPPTISTVTLKKVQPGGPDLTSTPAARTSQRSTLASRPPISSALWATSSYGTATLPGRLRTTSIDGEGRITILHTFASPTSSGYTGGLPSKDLLNEDAPGNALPNKDPPSKVVISQNTPTQELPKDLVNKVIYSKDLLTNDPLSMSHPTKDVLIKDHPGGNRRPEKFTDPVYGQSIGSATSVGSKTVQSSSHSTTSTESHPEKSEFLSSQSVASNPLTTASRGPKTLDADPIVYQEAVTFEFPALDIRKSSSPTPTQFHGKAVNVSTVSKGNPSRRVSFSRGHILATMLGIVIGFVIGFLIHRLFELE